MLIFDNTFNRVLIVLILVLFALMLLYTDYLQEVNFYQNQLQLTEFQVSFETYKLFQNFNVLTKNELEKIQPEFNKNEEINSKSRSKSLSKSKLNLESDLNLDLDLSLNFLENDLWISNANNMESFSLNPPFPDIDLTHIGPIFLENGLINLFCEYSFDTIRCTVGGKILAEKIYFSNTYFTNPKFEEILVNFGWKELIGLFKFGKFDSINTGTSSQNIDQTGFDKNSIIGDSYVDYLSLLNYKILRANKSNIELLTNYIMFFGSNGTNLNIFLQQNSNSDMSNNDIKLESIGDKYKFYIFIHTQICRLFILIYLKLTNFIFLLISLITQLFLHIPIYAFNFFKYEKHLRNDFKGICELQQSDESDMTGFNKWIEENEEIGNMTIYKYIDKAEGNSKENCSNKLRLRKLSHGDSIESENSSYSTSVDDTYSLRIQDVRKLFEKPTSAEYLYYPKSTYQRKMLDRCLHLETNTNTTDVEKGLYNDLDTCIENESTLVPSSLYEKNGNHQTRTNFDYVIMKSTLDKLVDKYYLFYLFMSCGLLFHLLVYEIVNICLYNLISGIFETIKNSSPGHLILKQGTILRIPKILMSGSAISGHSGIIHSSSKSGSMLLSALLNLAGVFTNILLAVIFHGIYIISIYTYTISIY